MRQQRTGLAAFVRRLVLASGCVIIASVAVAQTAAHAPDQGGSASSSLQGTAAQKPAATDPSKQTDQQKTDQPKTDQPKTEAQAPRLDIEVLVTAPRVEIPIKENPAATTVVGREVLQSMPKGIGVEEALRLVPGVKVDNQADGERVHLSIRGQGLLTERGIRGVKVLLDGLPLNDPTGFAPDLFDVDWTAVQRIEVLRGSASALYGGGSSGGVINISTRDGAPGSVTGRASIEAGSYAFAGRQHPVHDGRRHRSVDQSPERWRRCGLPVDR